MASADVEGACDGNRHEDVTHALLQKGVHPGAVCSFFANPVTFKAELACRGAPASPEFQYARGTRQESVEGPDLWNQVLDNALQERKNTHTQTFWPRDFLLPMYQVHRFSVGCCKHAHIAQGTHDYVRDAFK